MLGGLAALPLAQCTSGDGVDLGSGEGRLRCFNAEAIEPVERLSHAGEPGFTGHAAGGKNLGAGAPFLRGLLAAQMHFCGELERAQAGFRGAERGLAGLDAGTQRDIGRRDAFQPFQARPFLVEKGVRHHSRGAGGGADGLRRCLPRERLADPFLREHGAGEDAILNRSGVGIFVRLPGLMPVAVGGGGALLEQRLDDDADEFIELRQDDHPLTGGQRAMIRRNVQLESRLVDDLLDVTRIERGKLELIIGRVDLHEIIQRGLETTDCEFRDKAQKLTVELHAAEHMVQGDGARLQQVFWNLLRNASKFTPVDGEIRVISRNEPGKIVVDIRDTGIGIEADAVQRIFDPFIQADISITRKFGGLGLGLAIARAIVGGHEGELHVSSEGRGCGTTFSVSLPLETTTR